MKRLVSKQQLKAAVIVATLILAICFLFHPGWIVFWGILLPVGLALAELQLHPEWLPNSRFARWLRR